MSQKSRYILLVVSLLCAYTSFGQSAESFIKADSIIPYQKSKPYDPLRPAKAGFYSAILPGLGQAYNKRYWKVPIVYGALATSLYFYSINYNDYKRYRKAYKVRSAGYQDEFTLDDGSVLISDEGLINAQKTLKQNQEMSLLVFTGLYLLQIIEASVDAHLLQFNVDDNISVNSQFYNEPTTQKTYVGLSLNYKF